MSEYEGKTHDYQRRTKGVIETAILGPEGAPEWTREAGTLWNKVEPRERRKDSQLTREFVLAVLVELTADQQFEAAAGWANDELVSQGMIGLLPLHYPKTEKIRMSICSVPGANWKEKPSAINGGNGTVRMR